MPVSRFSLYSPSLNEQRSVTVFLPSDFDPRIQYPIVFCADGQSISSFAPRIKSGIHSQKLPELVLVGAHSLSNRSGDYVLGQDDSRFQMHELFFTRELPQWTKQHFGLQMNRDQTGVFGFSHGGAFALTMAARHRDLFGLAISFSTAGAFEEYRSPKDDPLPKTKFYLSAGTREKPLLKTIRKLTKHLRHLNVECAMTERLAGHDFAYWEAELPLALRWGFVTPAGE